MNILHYALGFPPYRSGGLTKFCVDFMEQQAKENHRVAMLWPGQLRIVRKKTSVRNRGFVSVNGQRIQSFEIINPLPISFDEGIADFDMFTVDGDKKSYDSLLTEFEPDVIHVHTLMGLHKGFLESAKEKRIRLVFSAHDFFPICPKVTMFRHGLVCGSAQTCMKCGICNTTALSLGKMHVLQSPIYRRWKDSVLVKELRKRHRDGYLGEASANDDVMPVGTAEDYKELREYYYSLLKMMDMVHYNSAVTKRIYESFFKLSNSCVISITHADIADNRTIKRFYDKKIRIRYLGSNGGGKGFFLLKEALDELWRKQQNFCLGIHFTPAELSPYMKVHGRYSYESLKAIFDETDILVAPSIWYETFGFTVLEALSYGVPVVISGRVGAKDILVDGGGIVIEDIDAKKLCNVLGRVTGKTLEEMNKVIMEKQVIMQVDEMSEQIERICYNWKC